MVPPVGGDVAAEDSAAASTIRRYEERLARDPGSLAFAPLAEAYRKAGRIRDAIALCREGLDRFPHYTTARLILAKAALAEGDLAAARAELTTLLGVTPRDVEARRLAGEIELKAGRWAEARSHLEEVAALDPTDREVRAALELLDGDGRLPEGSPLARVLADDVFATVSFGALCLEQGLADEAAQIFLRILKRDPDHAGARERLEPALRAKTQRRKGS
ncbi:MAG: tetratricopeptide repeat protein [Candidatus Rokubacteria bacterium]|nr:tetratricopeptide repeat protein [Candidatus Rokubacteria bacterium]